MSFTDHFNPHPARRPSPASAAASGTTGRPAETPVTDDLKSLLMQIASQINEVDQRHGTAMAEMQARLERLALDAEQARLGARDEAAPSIARIEDGVAVLSGRIADAQRDRAVARAAAGETLAALAAAAPDQLSASPAPLVGHAMEPDPAPFVPAPLRSSLTALDSALQSGDAKPAKPTLGMDPFDFAPQSEARDQFDPWDRDQAEALSKIYETTIEPELTQPAVFFPYPPEPAQTKSEPKVEPVAAPFWTPPSAAMFADMPAAPMASAVKNHSFGLMDANAVAVAHTPSAPTAVHVTAPAPAPVAGLGDDKAWLDSKFAEIAAAVEQSLAGHHPETAFRAVNDRLDGIEERFNAALDGVARRDDLDALAQIENQIGELATQFEKASAQLGRFDVVEWQIKELTQRLTDVGSQTDQLAKTQGNFQREHAIFVEQHAGFVSQHNIRASTPPPAPAAVNYDLIAQATAEEVARHLNHLQSVAPANDQAPHRELEQLLQSYIAERRHGDEQTASMLDTMQEAMIRLLDRVEGMERPMAPEPSPFVQTNGGYQAAAHVSAGEPIHDYDVLPEPAAVFGRRNPVPSAPSVAPAPAVPSHAAIPSQVDETRQPTQAADERAAAPSPAISAASPATAKAQPNTLKDFEAAALRAKAKAAASAGRPAGGELNVAAEARAAIAGGKAGARPGQRKGMPPALLIATICSVLVGSGFLLYTIGGSSKQEARMMPAASQPALPSAPAAALPSRTIEERPQPASMPGVPGQFNPTAPAAVPGRVAPAGSEALRAAMPMNDAPQGPATGSPRPATLPAARGEVTEPLSMPSPPKVRTIPETVNDDLSLNAPSLPADRSVPGGRTGANGLPVPVAQPTPATAMARPVGISVQQTGNAPSLQELLQIQQRQRMATASSQLGAIQSQRPQAPIGAVAVPASASAAPAPTEPTAADAGEPITRPSANIDLPPAMIGPMSLRHAAVNGDASAEFEVAARFAEGKGVPQDFKQAAVWYQRAASRGFGPAQYRLGTLYERGIAMPQDTNRAKIWYKRAAEQGNVKAMHNLAVLAAGADQSTPDYQTAATWFSAAAEYGLADSQFNLGVLYENGLGITRDQREAYKWYSLAARGGDREAAKRRDAIRVKVDQQEAKRVEYQVLNFRAKAQNTSMNDARVAGDAWRTRPAAAQIEAAPAVTPTTGQQAPADAAATPVRLPTVNGQTAPTAPKGKTVSQFPQAVNFPVVTTQE